MFNYFLYADLSPNQVSSTKRQVHASPHGPELGNGWNACVMSYGTQTLPHDLIDVWSSNTCITKDSGAFFAFNSCNARAPLNGTIPLFWNNTYASDDGNWTMNCGKTSWTLDEAQALGVEIGSTVIPVPTDDTIIAAARDLLRMG